jgi:two-component system sensor histidine kinase KdpD
MTRLRGTRPNLLVGFSVSVLSVAAVTAAIYPLKHLAPVVSLSVVYLLGVLLVSAFWGLAPGLVTSLLSAAAFNFFHIPPVGRFTVGDSRNWVALAAFTVVAVVVSAISELARNRAIEAERGRAEADFAAALARELLRGSETREVLGTTARRVAEALAVPSAAIELGIREGDQRSQALALRGEDGEQIATLLVPRRISSETAERLRAHLAPALGALVAIALRRDAMQEAAVETAALRRSDDVKTALLRAVSHDLRTPLTGIVAAGHALGTDSLSDEERHDLSAAVVVEGERLAALVDKLLDLSRLQFGGGSPRLDWVSLEDVIVAASEGTAGVVRVSIDPNVPEVRADAAQLERVFANLLENARRYSVGRPVSVNVRRVGSRVVARVVDQGPGIDPAERERIFEPFYRGRRADGKPWTGSGLGLSLPGQGTSFMISLPIEDRVGAPA